MTTHSIDKSHAGISFRPKAAPVLRVMGERITPLIDPDLGPAAFEVFDVIAPEGGGPPPHGHPWAEAYVVTDGELAVVDWSAGIKGPHEQILGAGGSAYIPGNVIHSFHARSELCRFTVISTRGAFALFSDMDATLNGATDDFQGLAAVAARNRVFMLSA